jgi:acetylornithine deacetylase
VSESVLGLQFNEERFVATLSALIGEAEHLQNNPPRHVPQEDRAIAHVRKVLDPLSDAHGGVLKIRHVSYVAGRGNLLVEYPGTTSKMVSFVGSHLDVVPADPTKWSVDPFKLTRDGDKLFGRGATDCLGHVALITDLLAALGTAKPALKVGITVVFIASEENSSVPGIGVDMLEKNGLLAPCKNGPVYWVDSADSKPCIGTGGVQVWSLKATGKLFHSGIPQKAINPIELAMDALNEIQTRFYQDFKAHPMEKEYNFGASSTMKPTAWSCPEGSLNQIKGEATISGDMRITPFYPVPAVRAAVDGYVADINKKLASFHNAAVHGPFSKYVLPDEKLDGKVEIEWEGDYYSGIACDMKSPGFKALVDAFTAVTGACEPFSLTGSLPLVRELQEAGFDLQLVGFGRMSVYHGVNEYCCVSEMKNGFDVLKNIIASLNAIL